MAKEAGKMDSGESASSPPSHDSYLLHCHWLMSYATQAMHECDENPGQAILSVVMAAASAEAYINELPSFIKKCKEDTPDFPELLLTLVDCLDELEGNKGSVTLKFLVAHQILTGKRIDKGRNPYQDFDRLFKLRNEIMHVKGVSLIPKDGAAKHERSIIESLEQKGLTNRDKNLHWIQKISTKGVALWACTASLSMMDTLTVSIPTGTGVYSMFYHVFFSNREDMSPSHSKRS